MFYVDIKIRFSNMKENYIADKALAGFKALYQDTSSPKRRRIFFKLSKL